jgi:hypothetical protein
MLGTGVALVGLLAVLYWFLFKAGISISAWDFTFLYSFGRLFLQSHGAHLYSLGPLARIEVGLVHPSKLAHGPIPNDYPPYVSVILAPLSLLPFTPAYFIWLVVNSALFLWSLYHLELFAGLAGRGAFVARLAALLFFPVIVALLQGQTTMFVLAAWTGCLVALRAHRDDLAGIALAASLIKPQYGVLLLCVLIARRRWPAAAWFAGVSCALLLLSIVTCGPGVFGTYAQTVVHALGNHHLGGFDDIGNRGFSAFFALLMPATQARVLTAIADVTALVLLLVQCLRGRSIDISLALAAAVTLLVSPHVLIHDLTLLLFPFAILLRYVPSPRGTVGVALAYVTVTGGFILTPVTHIQVVTIPVAVVALWIFTVGMRGSGDATPENRPSQDVSVLTGVRAGSS